MALPAMSIIPVLLVFRFRPMVPLPVTVLAVTSYVVPSVPTAATALLPRTPLAVPVTVRVKSDASTPDTGSEKMIRYVREEDEVGLAVGDWRLMLSTVGAV